MLPYSRLRIASVVEAILPGHDVPAAAASLSRFKLYDWQMQTCTLQRKFCCYLFGMFTWNGNVLQLEG